MAQAVDFHGAKAAFFSGTRLLTYLRDDKPGLIFRNQWDLPGGGREGDETPETCLLRELYEEFGLTLPPERLEHRWIGPAMHAPGQSVFFAGLLHPAEIAAIRFGDEGQYWQMMEVAEFLARPDAIPALQHRVLLASDAYL